MKWRAHIVSNRTLRHWLIRKLVGKRSVVMNCRIIGTLADVSTSGGCIVENITIEEAVDGRRKPQPWDDLPVRRAVDSAVVSGRQWWNGPPATFVSGPYPVESTARHPSPIWRPIETVDRDGQPVYLKLRNGVILTGTHRWKDGHWWSEVGVYVHDDEWAPAWWSL